jgi:hypothetical protein
MPDVLRLHQPLRRLDRLIMLHEGEEWDVLTRTDEHIIIKPRAESIRRQREYGTMKTQPEPGSSVPAVRPEATAAAIEPPSYVYVDEVRIADLRQLGDARFDLSKLISICEELNLTYRSQCYHSVAALNRAVLDHVPPIFDCKTFAEVANNYDGGKSFKDCMLRLEGAARKIADAHLHTRIRSTESVPTRVQVNFSNEIDVLLAEVVRVLQQRDRNAATSSSA